MAVDEIARRGGPPNELRTSQSAGPHWTSLAIPSYILGTAAMEAFLNELFLSSFGRLALGRPPDEADSVMHSDAGRPLEKLDLSTKLIEVPHAVLGRSLNRGQQPHQDMTLLTQLRNELVHYKMEEQPPKAVKVLAQRGIVSPVPPEQEAGGPSPMGRSCQYARRDSVGAQHGGRTTRYVQQR